MFLSVIIPTCNAADWLEEQLRVLAGQTRLPDEILVVDSASTDATPEIAGRFPQVRFMGISRRDFDHGATRTLAAQAARGDILVFLTQDAIPADSSALARLTAPLADARIAVAYGRQLPHTNATPFAAHLRLFNYPDRPEAPRCFADRKRLGLHTVFCSNSFAAYRRDALEAAGFFPERLLFGEDSFTVAKMLKLGYCVQYIPGALAFHSHNYRLVDEVKRYFDTGAFHAEARELLQPFGAATGAGRRFVLSELRYLLAQGRYHLLPASLVRNACKFVAYQLGRQARHLPLALVTRLSLRPSWWQGRS